MKVHRISRNATINLFCPSGEMTESRLARVNTGTSMLETIGYRVIKPSTATLDSWRRFRTGRERADELHAVLSDPETDLAIAAWGGKNSNDLLSHINYEAISNMGKPILGASDTAVLLNAISCISGITTYYGPNVVGKLDQTEDLALGLLAGAGQETNLLGTPTEAPRVIRPGKASGFLFGGSLGTFTLGLAGTPYMPAGPKIFFFESSSLDVRGIRQHLRHLELTGSLSGTSGVLVGALTKHDRGEDVLLSNSLMEIFDDNQPIVLGDFIGHGQYPNKLLPIGCSVVLSSDPIELTYERN